MNVPVKMLNRKTWPVRVLRTVAAVAIVCVILLVEFYIHAHIRRTTVTYTLLLAILYFAIRWDRLESIVASIVAAAGYLYYFEEPAYHFKASDPQSYITVAAFLIGAIVVSQHALTSRKRAAEALARKLETERLYALGQAVLASDSPQTTAWITVHQMLPIFGVPGAAFYLHATGETVRAGASDTIRDEDLQAAAVGDLHVEPVIHCETGVSILQIRIGLDPAGSLGICTTEMSVTILKALAGLLNTVLERVRVSEKLLDEKRVSESLLLNILPVEVADELRAKGMVSPKYFEDVTILFTDFVGFTLATEKLAAEELVELLHDYFTAFDKIAARYRLEKMKTIGDSYMCLSGLPQRNPAHPVDTVLAAFEMLQAVKDREANERAKWQVRIGIHTGPVVAGVVGINKFAFDIWGDTVNFSSRMEASGEANRINISERTYARVKDFFACEHRGKVMTKEKREFDMYFANGIKPVLLSETGESPPAAFVRRYHVYFQRDPPAFPAFLAGNGPDATSAGVVPGVVPGVVQGEGRPDILPVR